MTTMEIIGRVVVYGLAAWIALGIGLLCTTTVYISPATPWNIRLKAGLSALFILPWALLLNRARASLIVNRKGEELPERFLRENISECDCPRCTAARDYFRTMGK